MRAAVAFFGIAITACGAIDDDRAVEAALGAGADVVIDTGPVRGTVVDGIASFRGIRYAAPPTGVRRFAPPVPPAPWSAPFDATQAGPPCPQAGLAPDEDCLRINVWAHAAAGAPRPVIVWIHGGGYVEGSASSPQYDGAALARTGGAVIVSFGYRLGLLGFLALPQLAAPDGGTGNWGLRDQIAALQWIQRNIAAFGGDPARVMIAGESAGGASVCTLLAARAAQGLFHAAAMQSGTCRLVLDRTAATGTFPSAFAVGLVTAVDVGCTTGDLAACLRARPASAFLATQTRLAPSLDLGVPVGPALPVVDGVVLDQRPMAAIRGGRGRVAVIAGANRDDASAFITVAEAPGAFTAYLGTVGQAGRAAALLALYPPAVFGERGAAIAYATDVAFACPARALAGVRPSTSRLYHLERPVASGPLTGLGCVHGLDYVFLFGSFATWGIDPRPELGLATAMQQLWSAVAAAGAPPAWWPPPPWHLALDSTSRLATGWRGDRCDALAALGVTRE